MKRGNVIHREVGDLGVTICGLKNTTESMHPSNDYDCPLCHAAADNLTSFWDSLEAERKAKLNIKSWQIHRRIKDWWRPS